MNEVGEGRDCAAGLVQWLAGYPDRDEVALSERNRLDCFKESETRALVLPSRPIQVKFLSLGSKVFLILPPPVLRPSSTSSMHVACDHLELPLSGAVVNTGRKPFEHLL